MGLLDSVIGALGQSPGGANSNSSSSGGQADLISAVVGMLAQGNSGGGAGGLAGLVAKMQQSGLGDVVRSWISTGQNQPIAPDALGGVLGNDTVAGLAGQLGLNHGELLGQLAQMLPQVVDKLTPQGQIPHGDIGAIIGGLLGGPDGAQSGRLGNLGQLAGMLGGLLNKR